MGRFGHIRNGKVTDTNPKKQQSYSSQEEIYSSEQSFESESEKNQSSQSSNDFEEEENEILYVPTELDLEIKNIMQTTLMQKTIPMDVLKRVKEILLCEMEKIVHETVKRSVLKNSKITFIKASDLLQEVKKMGQIYQTKVAKTLVYSRQFQKLNRKDEFVEEETKEASEKPRQQKVKGKKEGKSKSDAKEIEIYSIEQIKEDEIFQSD